jgi:hypothetical protein
MKTNERIKEREHAFFMIEQIAIHIGKVLTEAEVLEGRSSIYEFIDQIMKLIIRYANSKEKRCEVRRIIKTRYDKR